MALEALRAQDYLQMVDKDRGTVDRRMFSDPEIYGVEIEHIFARAWNFMAHETQIPKPGDFFTTFIGEDRVIVVRDKNGDIQVFLNTCRHRGNAVCRAEEGHTSSFMCTYHGWTYDLQGNLIGVPGLKELYHEGLKREDWGLIKAAKVESYGGFIFATLDADAPPLDDYLGDVAKIGLKQMIARGNTKVVDGIVKWTIGCNWKFAADNVWDYYHGSLTHASASMAGWLAGRIGPARAPVRNLAPQISVLGEYGHAVGGPAITPESLVQQPGIVNDNAWREASEARELLGPVGLRAGGHTHVFPNLWIMTNFNMISLRLPKGPTSTEIWWFTFVDERASAEQQLASVRRSLRHNGPAGMFEIEDGENWDQSTRGSAGTGARRYPLNYSMNVGHGEVVDDETGPPHIDSQYFNEHPQLWYYRSWTEWMAAASWADLKANHSPVPNRV